MSVRIKQPVEAIDGASLTGEQRQWLADLYEAHFPAVYRVCTGVLRNPDDAADISQDVFLVAASSLRPDATKLEARAWLLAVAKNKCIDGLRRQKRLSRALVALGSQPDRTGDIEGTIADRHFLDSVINQLPVRERQALWQSAVESRPLADIAVAFRLNYMAAAQMLHRARRHAAVLAARVAILLGTLRLVRQRALHGTAISGQGIVAAAVLPIAVVLVVQSSSSRPGDAIRATGPGVVSGPVTSTHAGQPAGPLPSAGPARGPGGTLTGPGAGAGATLNTLADRAQQVLGGLPSLAPTPAVLGLPIPTPAIVPSPLPTPSLPVGH